ncbi:MAG: hypothetical protein MUP63_01810 [Candidatus Nanohaloarchaeota archaeon QJJ-7]|nr:hypothetical protein [Candidatus Nanohaloarchaeota archaeon QJJ-7]
MDAIIFSWSGSFREDFDDREGRIRDFMGEMQERGSEIGLVTDGKIEEVEEMLPTDFIIPQVQDLQEVLSSLDTKYDKTFFVSDVKAELVTANQSGAFTIGFSSGETDAEELGGVGPNYLVESLEELEKILRLETL